MLLGGGGRGLIADLVVEEGLSIAHGLSLVYEDEQAREMTDFAEQLYHKNQTPLHLALDEAASVALQPPWRSG
jgi:hypothetical protein